MTPGVPEDLNTAFEDLKTLISRIDSGAIRPENLNEEIDSWRAESCRGAATLAQAATNVLRYELANRGIKETSTIMRQLRSLKIVEDTVKYESRERETGSNADNEIVEVALPQAFRDQHPKARGYRMGDLQIIFEHQKLPGGLSNAHLSISHPSRYPTFEELMSARFAPGPRVPNLWALLPKPELQKDIGPHTIHVDIVPPKDQLG